MTVAPDMERALALAARAKHATSPNPMVGAVVVKAGRVVGEGYHRRAGGPHAEVIALRRAGAAARGATLYVTLEPCDHYGRTPPCTEAILAADIARVVVATRDPDPRVSGRGLARLRRAGVIVETGEGAAEAKALNARWLAARRSRRPYMGLKFAASLDGKIATRLGKSQWITGEAARAEGRRLRGAYAAVAVGAGTVLADDPELTARSASGVRAPRQPLRVVVDGALRTSPGARVHDASLPGRSLVVTTEASYKRAGAGFRDAGVWVETFAGKGPIDMDAVLRRLADHGVDSLLVEGGAGLAWSAVQSRLVDHVYAFIAPRLVGGAAAPSAVDGSGFAELSEALPLEHVRTATLGPDLLVEAIAVGEA